MADALFIAGGIGLTGILIGSSMRPDRQDLLNYVNEHNRQRPTDPLRFGVGYNPKTRMATGGLRYLF